MPSAPWKQRLYARDHYSRNRASVIAAAAGAKDRQRAFLRGWLQKEKDGKPCLDCGVAYPHYKLQFDHVRGKKRGNIADMVNAAVSLRSLRMEIAKCELVCANCHSGRTWLRLQEAEIDADRAVGEEHAELRLFE